MGASRNTRIKALVQVQSPAKLNQAKKEYGMKLEKKVEELSKFTEELLNLLESHGHPCTDLDDTFKTIKKRIRDEFCRRATGNEAGEYMERFVNLIGDDGRNDDFVDYVVNRTHRTLNQSLIGLFVKVLIAEGKTTRYDARNENSVKGCKALLPALEQMYLPFI